MIWFLLSFLASTVVAIFASASARNFVPRRFGDARVVAGLESWPGDGGASLRFGLVPRGAQSSDTCSAGRSAES